MIFDSIIQLQKINLSRVFHSYGRDLNSMILSPEMFDMLQVVLKTEPLENAVPFDVSDVTGEALGKQLIELYYKAEKQRSRSLIALIMQQAGDSWYNRLLDHQPLSLENKSTANPKMRSLSDFISLMAENDDYERSIQFQPKAP